MVCINAAFKKRPVDRSLLDMTRKELRDRLESCNSRDLDKVYRNSARMVRGAEVGSKDYVDLLDAQQEVKDEILRRHRCKSMDNHFRMHDLISIPLIKN